jgi:hypothetical protein
VFLSFARAIAAVVVVVGRSGLTIVRRQSS